MLQVLRTLLAFGVGCLAAFTLPPAIAVSYNWHPWIYDKVFGVTLIAVAAAVYYLLGLVLQTFGVRAAPGRNSQGLLSRHL